MVHCAFLGSLQVETLHFNTQSTLTKYTNSNYEYVTSQDQNLKLLQIVSTSKLLLEQLFNSNNNLLSLCTQKRTKALD